MTDTFDAIILGAGAAGLMCAAEAGRRGRRVIVLERAEAPGKKILISGGGRCNFTNIHTAPDRFLSANPHFAKSALSRYTPADFLALVESHGIAWHEKTLGQLFCDGSARQIVAMLMAECAQAGVQVACGEAIREVTHGEGGFTVRTDGQTAQAPALVIATAVTGRLDNEVVEITVDDTGPVRVVTDADTAANPERLGEIAEHIRERHRETEELRGIAEASGLPTDF